MTSKTERIFQKARVKLYKDLNLIEILRGNRVLVAACHDMMKDRFVDIARNYYQGNVSSEPDDEN